MDVRLIADCEPALVDALSRLAAEAFPEQPFSMAEEIARPWTRLWVTFGDGAPTAFLGGWPGADELGTLDVATRPSARRRGTGPALLHEVLTYSASHHVRLVLLEVRRSNAPAIGLYRKLGFSVFGVRRAYYADNDEDAIEMALVLDPETGRALPRPDEHF